MSKAKPEPPILPKRFYKTVGIDAQPEGYLIMLDGKPIRTPPRHRLQVPTQVLADAIAQEWTAQKEVIDTYSMPLTRLMYITLDRVPPDRAALLGDIVNYVHTDLIFYRAGGGEDTPQEIMRYEQQLRALQDAAFDPLLQWISSEFSAVFAITEGVMPVTQDATSVAKIAAVFAAANDGELAALAMMVPLLGSALIALALWKRYVTCDRACCIVRLDEDFQAEHWGMDPHTARDWATKRDEIVACDFFLQHYAPTA